MVFKMPISKAARDRYGFDKHLIGPLHGDIYENTLIFRDLVSRLADDPKMDSASGISVSDLNALLLIHDIFLQVIHTCTEKTSPELFQKTLDHLSSRFTPATLDDFLEHCVERFPPVLVYKRQISPRGYLAPQDETSSIPQQLLTTLLVFQLFRQNPAMLKFTSLITDGILDSMPETVEIYKTMMKFIGEQGEAVLDMKNLLDVLIEPSIVFPHSLSGQIEFMLDHWSQWIGMARLRLLRGLDLIREEERLRTLGSGPIEVIDYKGLDSSVENYSQDHDWMAKVVLIAKNVYVWLDQLSTKYQRDIRHLDHIPIEEFQQLADWGITGLWLIGVWERSPASAEIKHRLGNPDALASAYSLFEYRIADNLGGESALQEFQRKAAACGIRLGSDMVPNHTGIDSKWIIEHPEWFIRLDHCPYPSYTFTGPDLCNSPFISIFLEDHYYDHTDASVVFKRLDHISGNVDYIFHGNDGTSMPWNDTAQLDFLLPDVRNNVLKTILDVAGRFPIIRFDAAMTLTRQHFQRLWYPQPGYGGAIPSRSRYGLSNDEFDQRMPREFWREVVDRVQQEKPDTLLLAEAFWLLEGYFVRTLGMHRVYNSAFMHMLRDEKNEEYRMVLQKTLAYDPRILCRFVNFMSNPDEDTAAAQFSKGSKYFGVCVLLVALPGLPMFGHGQIEGFQEKYGMEFGKSQVQETPDPGFIAYHEKLIVPLLKRRSLFAGVEGFRLYDLISWNGKIDQDVVAFSNEKGGEWALVLFNNSDKVTSGWIHQSSPFVRFELGVMQEGHHQNSVSETLKIPPESDCYFVLKDSVSRLEYLYSGAELSHRGLFLHFDNYQTYVFMEIRQLLETEKGEVARLKEELNGRGVDDVQRAITVKRLEFFQTSFGKMMEELIHLADWVPSSLEDPTIGMEISEKTKTFEYAVWDFVNDAAYYLQNAPIPETFGDTLQKNIHGIYGFIQTMKIQIQDPAPLEEIFAANHLQFDYPRLVCLKLFLTTCQSLNNGFRSTGVDREQILWIFDWRLDETVRSFLSSLGIEELDLHRLVSVYPLLPIHEQPMAMDTPYSVAKNWFQNQDIAAFLQDREKTESPRVCEKSFDTWILWTVFSRIPVNNRESPDPTADVHLFLDEVEKLNHIRRCFYQADFWIEAGLSELLS